MDLLRNTLSSNVVISSFLIGIANVFRGRIRERLLVGDGLLPQEPELPAQDTGFDQSLPK